MYNWIPFRKAIYLLEYEHNFLIMNFKNFNFREVTVLFSQSFFVTLFSFILIRLVEFSWFQLALNQHVPWQLFFTKSVNLDIQYLGFVSIIGFLLFAIGRAISYKMALVFNVVWGGLLTLVQISLTQFHITNQTLLSSMVFKFSLEEIINIVVAEFVPSKASIFLIWFLVLISTVYFLIKASRFKAGKKSGYVINILFLILVSNAALNIRFSYKPIDRFTSIRQYLFSNSKPIFLYESFRSTNADALIDYNEIKQNIIEYQSSNKKKSYIDIEYPLIYKNNERNVLGALFKKSETPPNIVFIISESLSTNFSVTAPGLKGASLTPFTDKLAADGLYWSHFLSNAYRSFGVLPNILSSLPPSNEERGIINMKNKKGAIEFPTHKSMVSVLKENNYYTSHFYPGWSDFDNVKSYMKSLGADNLIEETDFDSLTYPRYGYWGYSDYELYRKGLDNLETVGGNQPKLSIFQTVAFHTPYDMVEPKYYKESYIEDKLESLNLKDNKEIRKRFSPDQLSSIFASDEALEYLFNRIKASDSFNNTIFVITGDHATGIDLTDHVLSHFHVPLIIYSPLLKESKTFKGLCSQLDIAPSLLALLKENYGINLNENAHWLGEGLDTSSVYISNNTFPLQMNGIVRPNYIHKEHIIFGNKVYRLENDFQLTPEENKDRSNRVKQSFEVFKKLNLYTTKNNKIWSNDF